MKGCRCIIKISGGDLLISEKDGSDRIGSLGAVDQARLRSRSAAMSRRWRRDEDHQFQRTSTNGCHSANPPPLRAVARNPPCPCLAASTNNGPTTVADRVERRRKRCQESNWQFRCSSLVFLGVAWLTPVQTHQKRFPDTFYFLLKPRDRFTDYFIMTRCC